MKRNPLPVDLLLVALALAFIALAAPASAAPSCVGIGEYYTFARQCTAPTVDGGWLPLLLLQTALVGGTLGLVTLRRQVLRMR